MFDDLLQGGGLSLDRLHTLCLLSRARGITEAAGGDANRQSQFSRQLAELEAFVGVELVNRSARPRRLTAAGEELAQIAQQSLAALDDFRRRGQGRLSRILVGAGDSVIQWLLLPRLKQLQAALPGTAFVFKNLNTAAITHGLENGEVDIGIVRQNALPEGMKTAGRFAYGHVLVIPADLRGKPGMVRLARTEVHAPLRPASRNKTDRAAPLDNLSSLPLALMEGAGDLRQSVERLAQEQGFDLDVRLECSSFSQIALAIASGNFAGILPDFAMPNLATTGKASAWDYEALPKLGRTMAITWSPVAAKLRPRVRETAAAIAKILRE